MIVSKSIFEVYPYELKLDGLIYRVIGMSTIRQSPRGGGVSESTVDFLKLAKFHGYMRGVKLTLFEYIYIYHS